MLRYRVPASTTNLAHGFDTLGMALAIYNEVSIEPGGDHVTAPDAADPGLAIFAERVRSLCNDRWATSLPGFSVRITGDVPIARGLGSSSTIILGVAAACQHLAGRPFDKMELIEIGAAIEGHPDNVAAACLGGFVVVGEVDGKLRCQRFDPPAGLTCEVIIPDFEVKTAEARKVLPDTLSKADHVRGLQRTALIIAALAKGDIEGLRDCFDGGWHESHRAVLNPHLEKLREEGKASAAIATFLSGSGSTVIQMTKANQGSRNATHADTHGLVAMASE
jgi:homoserine kinase